MKKLFSCLWLLLTVVGISLSACPVILFAQPTEEVPVAEKLLSYGNTFTQFNELLETKIINQQSDQLLQQAQHYQKHFNNGRKNLSDKTKHQIEKTYSDILTQISKINERLQALQDKFQAVQHGTQALSSLQQLASNPINQSTLTTTEQAQIPKLLNQSATLFKRFQTVLNDQKQTIEKLSEARGDLAGLITSSQSATARNGDKNIKTTDLSALLTAYKAKVTDSENQLNQPENRSLKAIQALQANLHDNRLFVTLLEADLELVNHLNRLNYPVSNSHKLSVQELDKQLNETKAVLATIKHLRQTAEKRQKDWLENIKITGNNPEIDQAFKKQLKTIIYQQYSLTQQSQALAKQLSQKKQLALLSHDTLYHSGQLIFAIKEFPNKLILTGYQLKISFEILLEKVKKQPLTLLGLTLLSLLATYLSLYIMAKFLTRTTLKKNTELGVISTLRKILLVIRKRFYVFGLCMSLLFLVQASDINSPSNTLINTLCYGVLFLALWFELTTIEVKLGTVKGIDAKRINIAAAVLVFFAITYRLAYLSSISLSAVQLFEKFLMLSLVAFALVFKKNIHWYLQIEKNHINQRLYRLYHWLVKLLPSAVILTAVTSLVGYGELAWLLLRYLGFCSFYLIFIVIGLISISLLRKRAKHYSLKRFKYGAFIAQDLINPLSNIIKVLWLWVSTTLLFYLTNWDSNSFLISKSLNILKYPLFNFNEKSFSLLSLLIIILSIYLIFRLAKWIKTFSYHWLYGKIKDLGLRNSLSIFSQYVIALFCLLIALKILGIDLTSLAVFAGALGVGIGLGLQDIAKNFISGILLLIERPLRSGDWVLLDGSEGYVKNIGMRAITLETFDKQEVIIPNGNAINNSFTNYTHSDNLIRTVLYIRASYSDAPETVLAVLHTTFSQIEDILLTPAPLAALWEYHDSAICYRIQYYIDLQQASTLATRTKLLNQIWLNFKEQGIEIPLPQQRIHLERPPLDGSREKPNRRL